MRRIINERPVTEQNPIRILLVKGGNYGPYLNIPKTLNVPIMFHYIDTENETHPFDPDIKYDISLHCSPGNPTGTILPKRIIDLLNQIDIKFKLQELTYAPFGKQPDFAEVKDGWTISYPFGKGIGAEDQCPCFIVAGSIQQMFDLITYGSGSIWSGIGPRQMVLLKPILNDPNIYIQYMKFLDEKYQTRRKAFNESIPKLESIGITVPYFERTGLMRMLDCTTFGDHHNISEILEKNGIKLLPGDHFGLKKNILRFAIGALTPEDIKACINDIVECLSKIKP